MFQSNHIWAGELIQFMHAVVFLSVAGYALKDDEHVRVDLLYERFSVRKKAIVNLFGCIFLLLPVCVALFYFSYDLISSSWAIFERSRESDGLPGVFILKSFIWVFAAFLSLQSVSIVMKSLITLRK